jgi:hypothetical protein
MTPGVGVVPLVSGGSPGQSPLFSVLRKASGAARTQYSGPRFWVGSRFLVGFWSFLVVFGSRLAAILRFYLTFQILSVHPTVFFNADGQNTVRRFLYGGIDHTI